MTATCTAVQPLVIGADFADDAEAQRDGFTTAAEMRAWFARVHGLPFNGVKITW